MRYLFLILTLLASVHWSAAQTDEEVIDSLNRVIRKNSAVLEVAEAYVGLTEILYVSNPDTIIPMCEKAIELIEQRYDQADPEEQHQLLIVKGTAYNNIGYIYDSKGQISKALEIYFKAIKIQEQLKDSSGLSSSYTNTGYIYRQQDDYENAVKYYMMSMRIKEALKDTAGIANLYLNLAGIFESQKKFKQSREYYLESLRLWRLSGVKKGIAAATNNLGYMFNANNQPDSALVYYTESMRIYQELGHKEGIGSVCNNLATIYYKKEKYQEALVYGKKALEIGRAINYAENIIDASYILEQIYVKTEDWKNAHAMGKMSAELSDSLFNEQTKKASLKQEMEYEYGKKEAVKEVEFQKERELAQAQKEKQQVVIIIVSIGLLLVLILSVVIYKRLLVTRRQRNLIHEQQGEILEKNEELNMQNEEIMAISEKIEQQNTQLTRQNHDIVSSIQYAKKIQQAILPNMETFHANLPNSFVLYLPKDIVSGDFYWMERLDNLVFFAAVDCTGHGVPGAFMSIIGSNGLNQVVREQKTVQPAQILSKLTDYVIERVSSHKDDRAVKDGMDIALCCLNLDTCELQYAGAYNPLYLVRNGELIQYKATKRPVGVFLRKNIQDFENHSIRLQKGDMVYIFSDGFADQFGGPEGKKYTYRKLREDVVDWSGLDPLEQRTMFLQAFQSWKGDESQLDDICVIGFKV